jgi:glycosyltransferase involved in cell wall biosynthesis
MSAAIARVDRCPQAFGAIGIGEVDMQTNSSAAAAPHLSVVIPCYNEAECLDQLFARVCVAASEHCGDDYEIVLIDDGSADATWPMMQRLAQQSPRLCAVRLSRNHGHQLALSAGLDLCRGKNILILDADLQDPPELLGPMLRRMAEEQADVVYGVRSARLGESWPKRASAKLFYKLLSHAANGPAIPRDTGDFRLMSRRALDAVRAMPERVRFLRGMVSWVGFRQVPFAYVRDERFSGTTKYPFVKMMRLAIDGLTGFSSAPLRMASYVGMIFAMICLAMMAYALAGWLRGDAVQGWTSLMIVVLAASSVQLFVLGVIGEYLGRLYTQAKNRPLYIVSELAGGELNAPCLGIVATGSGSQTSSA